MDLTVGRIRIVKKECPLRYRDAARAVQTCQAPVAVLQSRCRHALRQPARSLALKTVDSGFHLRRRPAVPGTAIRPGRLASGTASGPPCSSIDPTVNVLLCTPGCLCAGTVQPGPLAVFPSPDSKP